MRILHVEKFVRRDRGGAPAYMFDLLERQRGDGHEVEVFGMHSEMNEPTRFARRFAPNVELKPPPSGVVTKAAVAARMVWSRPAARAITAVLDDFAPDIVHCHNVYHQLTPSIFGPITERKIPIVMTVHDFKLVCPTYHLIDNDGHDCYACVGGSALHVLRKRCEEGSIAKSAVLAIEATVHRRLGSYDAIDRFLCPSSFMLDQLRQGGFDTDKLVHLPNAVDIPGDGDPTQRRPAGNQLLFVGRLYHRKGVDLLIDAMRSVPDASLVICGDGPELRNLVSRSVGLTDRITFTGHVDHARIRSELRRSACLVLPSRGSENQPMTILDAFANGVPVITSDNAPLRELVIDDETGSLFVPEDAADLSHQISRLLADDERRLQLGVKARTRALQYHDMRRHLEAVDAIYQEVLS